MYLANEFSHLEAAIQYSGDGLQRNFFMTLDDFPAWRKQNQRHGIFTTAFRYDKPEIREARMIGNLYIDFDVSDIDNNFYMIREDALRVISSLTAIFGIPKEMVHIFFSGSKGIHLTIPCETMGIQPHEELNGIFKLIAQDFKKVSKHDTVDTRIYDKVRLFRVPNSYHPKSGLYKIPLTFEELKTLSLGEMQELAKQPRAPWKIPTQYMTQANRMYQAYVKQFDEEQKREAIRRGKAKERKLNFMPPCIEYILENGVKEGSRNNTTAVLASYFMQRGVTEADCMERLNEWNEELCNPSLSRYEVERTVTSIYRTERRYGCATLKDLSICSSSCRLYKEPEKAGGTTHVR